MTELNINSTRERRRAMREDENGDRFISLKWFAGIMITILLSVMGAWAQARHSFESNSLERFSVLEKTQAGVLERLKANTEMLDSKLESSRAMLNMIYREIKEHRTTGK